MKTKQQVDSTLTAAPAKVIKSDSVAMEFRKCLIERGMNARQLSAGIDCAYDTVRKVCKGEEFPGPKLLTKICTFFALDFGLMQELVQLDKAIDKGWVAMITDEDPDITEIKRYWSHLSPSCRDEAVAWVKARATQELTVAQDETAESESDLLEEHHNEEKLRLFGR